MIRYSPTGWRSSVSEVLPLLTMLLGSFLLITYLALLNSSSAEPPVGVLILGVALLSLASAFSASRVARGPNHRSTTVLLVTLFVLSWTLLMIRNVRFDTLQGADKIWEYRVSRDTLLTGYWQPQKGELANEMIYFQYYYSLSLASIPTTLSMVTGLDLLSVYRFGSPVLGALIPVLLFLVLRDVFDDNRIAFLSSLLVSQCIYYFFILEHNLRQEIALIFLFLTLLVVFKFRKKPATSSVLFVFFTFGIVASHYTIVYLTALILVAFSIGIVLTRRLKAKQNAAWLIEPWRSLHMNLFWFLLLVSVWLVFVTPWMLQRHLTYTMKAFQSLTGHRESTVWVSRFDPLQYNPALGVESGLLVSLWFDFFICATFVGVLLFVFKEKKTPKKSLWGFAVTGIGLFFILWALMPGIIYWLGLERLFILFFFFSAPCLAWMLINIDARMCRRWPKAIGIVIFAFLALNLPINLLIPAQSNVVLYHHPESIPLETAILQVYSTDAGFSLSSWMSHTLSPSEIISVDYQGQTDLFSTFNMLVSTSVPQFAPNSSFLLLPWYYVEHGYWVYVVSGYKQVLIKTNGTLVYSNEKVSTIYDSQRYVLLQIVPSH